MVSPFSKYELITQEETLEISRNKGELQIGIPKETQLEEKRVCLTPDAVASLVAQGNQVVVENGAGEGSNFSDAEYSEAGAKISYDVKEAFGCNIILKVEPPSLDEIKLINEQSTLFSLLQLKTQRKEYFHALSEKKITAVAYDFIKDDNGVYPVLKPLSEIAGTSSILIGSEIMSNQGGGKGLLMGNITGIPPTDVVILGAGTVAEFAAKAALGLGARVKVFDNSISKLGALQCKVNSPIYTSTVQPKTLFKAMMRCDIAIGAMRGESRSPIYVTENMVREMKEGAVIIDVSIDRGGCFETSEITSHKNPTFTKHGVIHYCVPNITARYARSTSLSMSNIFTPLLLNIARNGGFESTARYDKSLLKGMYFYHGVLTNENVAQWFDLPHQDINLLFM